MNLNNPVNVFRNILVQNWDRISNTHVRLADHNCVKSNNFKVCCGDCWVPTLSLQETWTSTTQSTYSQIFCDYTIGIRISKTHVQLVDHNCVKPRQYEVGYRECWVPTRYTGPTWFESLFGADKQVHTLLLSTTLLSTKTFRPVDRGKVSGKQIAQKSHHHDSRSQPSTQLESLDESVFSNLQGQLVSEWSPKTSLQPMRDFNELTQPGQRLSTITPMPLHGWLVWWSTSCPDLH